MRVLSPVRVFLIWKLLSPLRVRVNLIRRKRSTRIRRRTVIKGHPPGTIPSVKLPSLTHKTLVLFIHTTVKFTFVLRVIHWAKSSAQVVLIERNVVLRYSSRVVCSD